MKKLLNILVFITVALISTACSNPTTINEPKESEIKPDRAQEILDTMTLEEKVGQLFFVRYPQENQLEIASEYSIGGYVLFAVDFQYKTPKEITSDISQLQSSSKIPLFIGVDEEGGTINRISKFTQFRSEPFNSPQDLYAEGGLERIGSDTNEKCALLKSLGININLAPVCDISTDSSDFIYERTLGQNADITSQYVNTVVNIMNKNGVGCALKHFPGYGNNGDSHTDLITDTRSRDEFENNDLLPFKSGIDSGANIVLVSHNIVNAFDPVNPASLSPAVHELLRNDLNFNGLIMTDELSMGAIKQYIGDSEAAVDAILAGNDLLCCTDYALQIPAVVDAVNNGVISKERIDESAKRIIQTKLNLNIIE